MRCPLSVFFPFQFVLYCLLLIFIWFLLFLSERRTNIGSSDVFYFFSFAGFRPWIMEFISCGSTTMLGYDNFYSFYSVLACYTFPYCTNICLMNPNMGDWRIICLHVSLCYSTGLIRICIMHLHILPSFSGCGFFFEDKLLPMAGGAAYY